jgi:guanylate kinase
MTVSRRGLMLVLSSPSGAGKTTISRQVLAAEAPSMVMSVSVTTRAPRPGERDGDDYFFIDEARFRAMAHAGALLEHASVFGKSYGTPRAAVDQALAAGRDVMFDIDWQGAQQLRQKMPRDVVGVFILPPTFEDLERRLKARAQDPPEIVAARMAKNADEMSHWAEYDYIVVNRDVSESVRQVRAILDAERLRRERQIGLDGFVRGLMRPG